LRLKWPFWTSSNPFMADFHGNRGKELYVKILGLPIEVN
jgi:hypothetical protein